MQQNEAFFREHPDIQVMTLTALFRICQKRRANSLQEAYEHAYGIEGEKNACFWCHKQAERDKYLNGLTTK